MHHPHHSSWGQACNYGELGHGATAPKSATNAIKAEALDDMDTFDVACGMGHTLLLVADTEEKLATLPVIGKLVTEAPAVATATPSAAMAASKKRKESTSEGPKTKAAAAAKATAKKVAKK